MYEDKNIVVLHQKHLELSKDRIDVKMVSYNIYTRHALRLAFGIITTIVLLNGIVSAAVGEVHFIIDFIIDEPPATITGLTNISFAYSYINWTWTDPIDSDFDKVMIYLNGTFKQNVTRGMQYYNATGLTPATAYEIGTKTVDIAGNVNDTWKNHSATTGQPVLKVHNINKGTNYSTIQSAIDDANSGNEIHVDNGTFFENVNVNKSVKLIGAGVNITILNASNPNDHAFNITSNSVNISGFTVTGAQGAIKSGIYLNGVNHIIISNNSISNNYVGVYLNNSNLNTIINDTINNNIVSGISISNSNNNNVINNNLIRNLYGLYLFHAIDSIFANNYIILNNYGIHVYESNENKIFNNYFNNTNNFQSDLMDISSNDWNTTITSGTNIIGGPYIGGNFWANSSGTDFSQTCPDVNLNGICDLNNILDILFNVDYLPLTIPADHSYIYGSVLNNTAGIADATVVANTINSTNTDASGRYSILVSAGTNNLIATSEPRFYPNNSVIVTVDARMSVVQDIELAKKPTGNITGIVTN